LLLDSAAEAPVMRLMTARGEHLRVGMVGAKLFDPRNATLRLAEMIQTDLDQCVAVAIFGLRRTIQFVDGFETEGYTDFSEGSGKGGHLPFDCPSG
jgi:hypothetical protein